MPRAELDPGGTQIHVATTYADRQLMLMVPGARFHKASDGWLVPLAWSSCLVLRGLFDEKLTVGPLLASWANGEYSLRLNPALELRDKLNLEDVKLTTGSLSPLVAVSKIEANGEANPNNLHLYGYQLVDVAFLATNRRALLANEPGLGKTGVAIRTLQTLDQLAEMPYPAVVVCPNSLKTTVWQREFAKWSPRVSVAVVDGGAGQRRRALESGADVLVINWESLRLHSRLAPYGSIELSEKEKEPKELNGLGLRTAIFDEAHRCADPHSKQTRAAWAVSRDAEFCFALTGTPVTNNAGSAWALFHLVEPTWFPAKTRWVDRYVRLAPNFYGGSTVVGLNPATEAELHRVIDPLIRRVPKSLALPQLPPKLPTEYRETPMSPGQRKAYLQMQELMVAQLDEGLITAGNALTKLTRLSQFASASAYLAEPYLVRVKKDDGSTVEEERQDVKLKLPSNKVDDLVDLLEDLGDEQLVVGAESRQLVELAVEKLTSLGITNVSITGAQSVDERAKNVDRFQGGHARVVLCTLGAGAEGLTLTAASRLLFLQQSYSQVRNLQFADRIHRIGQAECVQIYVQVTPSTIDTRRIEILAGKESQAQEILRDAETIRKLLGAK